MEQNLIHLYYFSFVIVFLQIAPLVYVLACDLLEIFFDFLKLSNRPFLLKNKLLYSLRHLRVLNRKRRV